MSQNATMFIVGLIFVGLAVFLIWFLVKKTKRMKIDHVHLITGGVKSGKTTLAVATALKKYKQIHRAWAFRRVVCKPLNWIAKNVFQKPHAFDAGEEPLLYSNIVLAVPYVPLTSALINREERFRYKSVILVSESSLVADSYDIKNPIFNDNFNLFNKLIGHETKGGYLIYETQSLSDNHFAVKRVLCSFSLITKCITWLPFFVAFKTRDLAYNADASVDVNNVFTDDVDVESRYVIVPKSVWKKFDCYTYSIFTDHLPCQDKCVVGVKKNLKTDYLLEVNKDVKNK